MLSGQVSETHEQRDNKQTSAGCLAHQCVVLCLWGVFTSGFQIRCLLDPWRIKLKICRKSGTASYEHHCP
ncbi:unnamed protein product [Nezara viridula]|uniref:Uncharacterized protein n=1 Tax=Nezara viridula TaxID=85310 RepID=A0A9P0MJW9_NEZVI|nr:unnamed protein product [Nezara viridula]